jgi:hypothetical protein
MVGQKIALTAKIEKVAPAGATYQWVHSQKVVGMRDRE